SNGAGDHLHIGRNGGAALRRVLIQFDVAAGIPAGATINAASLTLYVSRGRGEEPHPAALHRLLAPWGEGTSHATGEEGGGIAAAANDATWSHRLWDTQTWATPGGDLVAQPSASALVGVTGETV